MDKVSVINQIKIALEGLLSQTQQLEKSVQPLHQIDKDLLLEKTRSLYEQIIALENVPREEKMSGQPSAQENDIPAVEETDETVVVEENERTPEIQTEENQEILVAEPEETVGEPEKEGIPLMEEKAIERMAEVEPTEEKTEEPVVLPKTTLDLFSESPETLGDTLTPAEKPVVADNLQMNSINDLREAIGINDKFLFINELFNGDLERYNKVIDELNGFSGLSGAQTYLTELQVQYQWAEEGRAYQNLNILLERKFA